MAGIGARFSKLRPLCNSMNRHSSMARLFQSHNAYSTLARHHDVQTLLRPSYLLLNRDHGRDNLKLGGYVAASAHCYSTAQPVSSAVSSLRFRVAAAPFVSLSPFLIRRSYSSSSGGGNSDKFGVSEAASGGSDAGAGNSGVELVDKVKDSWQSAEDAVAYTGQKAKEVSDGLSPYAQQVLESYPYLNNVIVPAGATLTGTVLAWVLLPKILRRFHKYSLQTPAAYLSGGMSGEQIPYEKSFWCALESPMRFLFTVTSFSQMAVLLAPNIASVYLAETWKGALIVSLLWFLEQWKSNFISRVLTDKSLVPTDREKIQTVDRFSSVGLFAIGGMAFAEAYGVAVQSILTVGGVGGVATAFAARDILGNVLSGLSMHFSRPFSLGDTIKAGSIEGQVVEMGLTTTSLLSAEKFPIIVPNSMFSSQAIVNKSRAKWRSMISKIPMTVDDVEKIPQISSEIKSMMKSNPSVFLEKEAPYCFLSRIESSFAELTLGCNLRSMSKEELYSTQQEILLQLVRILKEHGAKLGSYGQDTITLGLSTE